mmetsp:Transcript_16049/g.29339  ORF Transcript_16049/g.29339 Transcript_16049/m.29339 type:complete len:200 (+) Transcript_16049:72-671(+)
MSGAQSAREAALEKVAKSGITLGTLGKDLCGDREVVLTAVGQHGAALPYASQELRADREVVLKAVSHVGTILEFAASELRSDREVVATAVAQSSRALVYASKELLEDEGFAPEARQELYLFRVAALSGESCLVALEPNHHSPLNAVVQRSCSRLGIEVKAIDGGKLLFGTEVVPDGASDVNSWPGSPSLGAVVEYQLVK